jgi:polar amino acid transport system substrate-binding protein
MSTELLSQLAPQGVLRAAINMSNPLLVTGQTAQGEPAGLAPDMARAIAEKLGVPVAYVPFAKPGLLADAVGLDVWDIGLIADEPARAEKIGFTQAYVEIEATYLVRENAAARNAAEIDQRGMRISVEARAAFELWLTRNIEHAELFRYATFDQALDAFVQEKSDALADLRPRLHSVIAKLPGTRILDGNFTAVRQAVGTARDSTAALEFLRDFVGEAVRSGLVEALITKHGVRGLLVTK